MNPEQTLAFVERQLEQMEKAKSLSVKVGLPAGEQATSKAYTSDGEGPAPTVLEVGVWHEYGTQKVPQRSFLRGPLDAKQSEMTKVLESQFNQVLEQDLDVEKALGRVGLAARNICVGAFRTKGYGVWKDITQATKNAKGSSGILIDTGLLRGSLTWVVE